MNQWKRTALYFHVFKNVRLVGHLAYGDQPDKLTTTKDAHKPATKKLFASMKSLQETTFKRFKDFKILWESFSHGVGTEDKLKNIKMAVEATAVLAEYDLEFEGGLFEV